MANIRASGKDLQLSSFWPLIINTVLFRSGTEVASLRRHIEKNQLWRSRPSGSTFAMFF